MSTTRLDKLFSNLGYGSRKEAALLVKQKRIALSGVPVARADESIAPADVKSGALTLDGVAFDPPSPLYVMFHKPSGYSCSHEEKGAIIYELLPERWQRRSPALSCAGRLDKYSTGQVILTDDGDFLHRIIHPKSHAPKYYAVTLEKPLRGDEAALFGAGEFLMAGDDKPLKIALWVADGEKSGRMTLTEGRFHQIRRMFETIGNKVETLHRFKTGMLELGDLQEGHYRLLDEADLQNIFTAKDSL